MKVKIENDITKVVISGIYQSKLEFYYHKDHSSLVLHCGLRVWAVYIGGVDSDTPIEEYLRTNSITHFLYKDDEEREFINKAMDAFIEYLNGKRAGGGEETPETLEDALVVIERLVDRITSFY